MNQAEVSASCKTITTDPDKGPVQQLFVLVHWHEDSRRFDVSLTDCSNSWIAEGCTTRRNELNVDADQAWHRAKEALGDGNHGQYIYWTTKQQNGSGQQLQMWWAWELGPLQGREVMALQPPLQQQQDGAAALRNIMSHMMESYSTLKAAVSESKKAQQLLERSLADKEALLKQKVQAEQEQEKVLFTKFAMLLNKKTERIQLLTEKVQQQEQQLQQLRGMEEQDTDDEAKAMEAYLADTEDEEVIEQVLEQSPAAGSMQQQSLPGSEPPAAVDIERENAAAAAASNHATEAAGSGPAGGVLNLEGATQPLDDAELAALEVLQQQRAAQQQSQQPVQQTAGASVPAVDRESLAGAPAAAAGVQVGGIDWNAVQQVQQGGAVDAPAVHKSKAIKRRR